MAWCEKRKGGWTVCARQPQGQPERYRSGVFATKAAAQRHAVEVQDAIATGQRYEPPRIQEEPTLEAVIVAYLQDLDRHREDSTVETYTAQLSQFLRWMQATRGHTRLTMASLSQTALAGFWSHLRTEPPPGSRRRKASTINSANLAVQVVQRLWRWASESDTYESATPGCKRITVRYTSPAPTTAPTWAEMDACINWADREWQRRALVVMRYTGLRVKQACGLMWTDVDLERCTVTIRPAMGKTQAEKAGRTHAMSPHLAAEMAGWGTRRGRVIGEVGTSNHVSALTRECWTNADVSPDVWDKRPCHAFRKGWRTGLAEAGADERAAEYLMGHSQGLVGVYVDPRAHDLVSTVALVPEIGSVAPNAPPVSLHDMLKRTKLKR